MIRGIDHVVVLVEELEAAMARYRELGFTVVPGGRHPSATENALVCFRDGSYLELIAFWDASDRCAPVPPSPGGRTRHHRLCPRRRRPGGDRRRAPRARACTIGDPQPGARRRPDGVEVAWKMAFPADAEDQGLPFLIEDVTDRGRRVPDRGARRSTPTARSGSTGSSSSSTISPRCPWRTGGSRGRRRSNRARIHSISGRVSPLSRSGRIGSRCTNRRATAR